VEKPEETKTVTPASAEESKAQRPQAAVKGITPAQPAPKREEKQAASGSLFGKLFGWLLGSTKQEKPAEPAKARPQHPRRERDGNRSESGQQGNRQRNKPRRDRDDTNAPRADNTQQNKGQQQEPRGERPPRQPRPAATEKPVLETSKPVAANEQHGEETANTQGRKRGRRGGRREREKREQEMNGGQAATQEMNFHSTPATSNEVAVTPEVKLSPQTPSPVAEPAVTPPEVTTNVVTEMPTPVVVVVSEAVLAVPVTTTVTPAAESIPAVQESIAPALSAAGLVMIETDPNKAAFIVVPQESSTPAPRRRARPREVYTAESNEPLVMIETQQPK
jgi:ribonuclease E